MEEFSRRVQRRVERLPGGLKSHIYRVRDIAGELAEHYHLDGDLASLGMLCHDVARAMPNEELLDRAGALGLSIGEVDRLVPILLHGPVGAEILKQEDGLDDQSVYNAVYWHTTSHPALDQLGKIVFLADKLDPVKISAYPYQPKLRELAFQDVNLAIMEFLTRETYALASRGQPVHPMMLEARDAMLNGSINALDDSDKD